MNTAKVLNSGELSQSTFADALVDKVEEQLELVTNPMVLPSYNFEVHDIGPKRWTQ